jgi:hypothetical protein
MIIFGNRGETALSHGAVTVDTTAGGTQILPANSNRASIRVQNLGSAAIYVGNTGVTSATGWPIATGATDEFKTVAALYAIAASGSCDVRYMEETGA